MVCPMPGRINRLVRIALDLRENEAVILQVKLRWPARFAAGWRSRPCCPPACRTSVIAGRSRLASRRNNGHDAEQFDEGEAPRARALRMRKEWFIGRSSAHRGHFASHDVPVMIEPLLVVHAVIPALHSVRHLLLHQWILHELLECRRPLVFREGAHGLELVEQRLRVRTLVRGQPVDLRLRPGGHDFRVGPREIPVRPHGGAAIVVASRGALAAEGLAQEKDRVRFAVGGADQLRHHLAPPPPGLARM